LDSRRRVTHEPPAIHPLHHPRRRHLVRRADISRLYHRASWRRGRNGYRRLRAPHSAGLHPARGSDPGSRLRALATGRTRTSALDRGMSGRQELRHPVSGPFIQMPQMTAVTDRVLRSLRAILDYTTPGMLFQDITPVLAGGELLRAVVAEMCRPFGDVGVA